MAAQVETKNVKASQVVELITTGKSEGIVGVNA